MLSLPIFDGGARAPVWTAPMQRWEEDVANYRGTVLRAFKEVEDNLANLRILDEQNKAQDTAVSSANRAARISRVQYREGAVSYLSVIDSDRSALQQQLVAVSLDGERARSVVNTDPRASAAAGKRGCRLSNNRPASPRRRKRIPYIASNNSF